MTHEPIRKSTLVEASPDDAYRVFTAEIATWWPLATKSVGQAESETLVMEAFVGGRLYERTGGEEVEWGEILVWEAPHRLVFSWYPGRGSESGQEVELRFQAERGGTRVDLEHRGWERLGKRAAEALAHYVSGWDEVLERYADAVAGARSGT